MKYQIGVVIIAVLTIIYNILLIFDKNFNINMYEQQKKVKLKKWEKVTTFCVMTVLFSIILYISISNKNIRNVYSFIYYLTIFSFYISMLVNIILKKDDKKISKRELSILTLIPAIFVSLYNFPIGRDLIETIKKICNNFIIYYILAQNIKYFLIIFFMTMDIFLVIVELKSLLTNDKRKKQKNDFSFDEDLYVYKNARGEKGFLFFINYVKDIVILIKLKIISIVRMVHRIV